MACFVVLQLLDIILEPLGAPVAIIRWVMLAMIAVAPVIVIAVIWHGTGRSEVVAPRFSNARNSDNCEVFHLGEAEVDSARREIRFSGSAADVQPKVFDLIEYLLRARDRVVSKNELLDSIWPDVVVTEASLTQSVKRARDLFRRNGFDREVIRTVSRKGYQIDANVTVASASESAANVGALQLALPSVATGLVAAVLGVLVWNSGAVPERTELSSSAENSLVVLPFENMTPDPDFRYFSDGLTETLTNSLTSVRNLRVIARGSAFSFRDTEFGYETIGRTLNVAHIVEGSVQRSGDDLRVSARLVRVMDGHQLWSQVYNRAFDDVFRIQDEISLSIVDQMSALLSTQLVLDAAEERETVAAIDAEAYRLLLLGRANRRNASAGNLQTAEDNFRAALSLEPDFADAKIALAEVLRNRASFGELPREPAFAEALVLVREVLGDHPRNGDAYLQLGEIQHRHLWDFDAANQSYSRALELNPGSAGAHSAFGRFLSKAGDFTRSIQEAEIALDLDPRSASAASSLAFRHIRARQLDAARRVIDSLRAMHPDYADLPWLETNWHIRNGSYRDALQWVALEELDYLRLTLSAIALHHLDRKEQARKALDELIETDEDGAAFQIAGIYAQWGEVDSAFRYLERAYSSGDPGLAELYSGVHLENLHADPRFAALAGRIGLPAVALR